MGGRYAQNEPSKPSAARRTPFLFLESRCPKRPLGHFSVSVNFSFDRPRGLCGPKRPPRHGPAGGSGSRRWRGGGRGIGQGMTLHCMAAHTRSFKPAMSRTLKGGSLNTNSPTARQGLPRASYGQSTRWLSRSRRISPKRHCSHILRASPTASSGSSPTI